MSANTQYNLPRPGLPMPAKRVAEICQLTPADIYRAHTPEMGSPGHFVYPEGATQQSYTLEGLCALVEGLQAIGHDLEAKILAVEVARLRGMAPPAAPVVIAPPPPRSWAQEAEARQDAFYGRDAA